MSEWRDVFVLGLIRLAGFGVIAAIVFYVFHLIGSPWNTLSKVEIVLSKILLTVIVIACSVGMILFAGWFQPE